MKKFKEIGEIKIADDSPKYGEFIHVDVDYLKDLGHAEDDISIYIYPTQSDRYNSVLHLKLNRAKKLAELLQNAIKFAESR